MAPMSDKELDNLFKNKFEDAEFAPSDALWGKIEKQLASPKKRKYPIFWMAAASITLVVGSFALFQKNDKVPLQLGNSPVLTQSTTMDKPNLKMEDSNILALEESAQQDRLSSTYEKQNSYAIQAVAAIQEEPKLNNNSEAMQPIESITRLDDRNQETLTATVMEAHLGIEAELANAIKTEFNPSSEEEDPERKHYKGVTGIVNFVVDKVDKREQKILKFSPDEDDNMRLVGINIGLLKWNKKNR